MTLKNNETEYWYVTDNGYICTNTDDGDSWDEYRKEVGNYFSSREEARKAVERLRAWKRLKDRGFRFVGWDKALRRHESCDFVVFCDFDGVAESARDLNLLFGGEE